MVIILDGDGASLMQLGAMATIGHYKPENIKHILIDNNAYESTGGQKTISNTVFFDEIAKSAGYVKTYKADIKLDIVNAVKEMLTVKGPVLLVIKSQTGSRTDLGRPLFTPEMNKERFMNYLK